jgi:hypothetical protein
MTNLVVPPTYEGFRLAALDEPVAGTPVVAADRDPTRGMAPGRTARRTLP